MKNVIVISAFMVFLSLVGIISIVKFATEMSRPDTIDDLPERFLATDNFAMDVSRKLTFRRSMGQGNKSHEASERFPYLAAVIATNNNGGFFSCFGCVILTQWVLTAAHCMVPEHSHRVLFYSDYIRNRSRTYPVLLWQVHEEYQPNFTDPLYDIAVVKIDLSRGGGVARATFTRARAKKVQASLWKTVLTMDKMTYLTHDLDVYNLGITHPSLCSQSYGITIDMSLICVEMSRYADCFITEFGPLFAYEQDRVVGLLTMMKPKDCDGRTAIFTNVSYHRNWISRVTNEEPADDGKWLLKLH